MIQKIALALAHRRLRNAADLADLADLQADLITNHLADWGDDDWRPMYSALIALGRAGVVVGGWRPGFRADDGRVETCACFTGFADDETKDWLDNLMYFAAKKEGAVKYGYASVYETFAPGCPEYDQNDGDDSWRASGTMVARVDGYGTATIGAQMTAEQTHQAFPLRNAAARAELQAAWQITVCSPMWGDNSMFSDLVAMLYAPDATRAAVAARAASWSF